MSLYDEEMRRPLRPRRLSERLRALAPRPISAIITLVLVLSIGSLGFIMRQGDPNAGEPLVRIAMPSLDPTTSSPPAADLTYEEPPNAAVLVEENPELAPLPEDEELNAPIQGETIVQEVVGIETNSQIRLAKAPIPGLWEKGPQGPLPRISPNGRKPALAYARPVTREALKGPRIVLIIGGLGLSPRGSRPQYAIGWA